MKITTLENFDAVVLKDVPKYATAVGVPARIIRKDKEGRRL